MASPNEATVEILHVLFGQWQEEHERLDQFIRELNAWMTQKSLQQAPDFAEARTRLQTFDQRLREHFLKEHAMGLLLAETRGVPTPEIEEFRRHADKEHEVLASRLNNLIESLAAESQPIPSWSSAVNEFGLFLDALEQHEEIEADRARWLIPSRL